MPEHQRHALTVQACPCGHQRPKCSCGWKGARTRWDAEVHAQFTDHVRDAGIITAAFQQAGMHPTDAEHAADALVRHVP